MKKINDALIQFEKSLNNSQNEQEKKKAIKQFAHIVSYYTNDEVKYLISTETWKNKIEVDIKSEFNKCFKSDFFLLIKFKFSDENSKTVISIYEKIKILDEEFAQLWDVFHKEKKITIPLIFHCCVKGEVEKVKYLIAVYKAVEGEDKLKEMLMFQTEKNKNTVWDVADRKKNEKLKAVLKDACPELENMGNKKIQLVEEKKIIEIKSEEKKEEKKVVKQPNNSIISSISSIFSIFCYCLPCFKVPPEDENEPFIKKTNKN